MWTCVAILLLTSYFLLLPYLLVGVCGHRQRDIHDDATEKSTMSMLNFVGRAAGAVHRCDPAKQLIDVSDASFSAGNWLVNTPEGKKISTGLQMMCMRASRSHLDRATHVPNHPHTPAVRVRVRVRAGLRVRVWVWVRNRARVRVRVRVGVGAPTTHSSPRLHRLTGTLHS